MMWPSFGIPHVLQMAFYDAHSVSFRSILEHWVDITFIYMSTMFTHFLPTLVYELAVILFSVSKYLKHLCKKFLICSRKTILIILTNIVIKVWVCHLRASATLFSLPFVCLISKSNSLRNSIHRACLALRLGWLNKYSKLKCFVSGVKFFPNN